MKLMYILTHGATYAPPGRSATEYAIEVAGLPGYYPWYRHEGCGYLTDRCCHSGYACPRCRRPYRRS